ncbi:phosphatidate cytidylyltransferase, partial [Candidatus Fermentibacterales bacterium]|nr:phosphatidate cytidylyltransferase [Candidatus Fermentibacterales bacterium]
MSRFAGLSVRTLSAALGMGLFALVIIPSHPPVVVSGFFSLLGLLAGMEAAGLHDSSGHAARMICGVAGGGLTLAVCLLGPVHALACVPAAMALVAVGRLLRRPMGQGPGDVYGTGGMIVVYSVGFGMLARHRLAWPDFGLILIPLAICWIGDTAAYLTGSAIGRHKLVPAVSPSKSWEGLGGQVVGSVLGAVLAGWILARLGLWGMVLLGA